MKEKRRFYLYSGYGGGINCGIVIGEEHNGKTYGEIEKIKAKKGYIPPKDYRIDLEDIGKIVLNAIDSEGYTITQTKRQKYPRLKINGLK